MTEQAEFMAKIIADRDDDAPRLVYADWLDEHGEPERAEFIRVQCKIAASPCSLLPPGTVHLVGPSCRGCDRVAVLRRRERELAGCDDFPSWCPRVIVANCVGSVYRRGFVAAITCTADTWLKGVGGITAANPVEEVTLTTMPGVQVARLPFCEQGNGEIKMRAHHELVGMSKVGELASSWPTLEQLGVPRSGVNRNLAITEGLLRHHWPRIKFNLPPVPVPHWNDDIGDYDEPPAEAIFRDMDAGGVWPG